MRHNLPAVPMRVRTLVVVSLTVLVVLMGSAPASGARFCSGTVRAHPGGGPNIIATNIETVRVSCRPAKRLLRTYFREVLRSAQTPGGCAHQRQNVGCRVKGWRCTTRYVRSTNSLRGRCARRGVNGQRVIRFDERDIGPG